ncbi:unnamed protein product [Bursaphelenchus xylophilus]|uniref:(pine wood nematode) hypothetical protein n=1 Tax=Bursaphelenchus xylophilus TaxID=6326 RepID=A0A1I7SSY2_BURXY|nr:unnamed protein product [Bursaphelenchus xylophilus]CAG9108840.1 unnamed protein product [Bursaphelenchus xylophilus]
MNVSSDEQELIQEAFQYYDRTGDNKISVGQVGICLRSLGCVPTEKQLALYTKQWASKDASVAIEEFIPIYGALKKQTSPADRDRMMACLSNFDRDQEGYIQQADLRHILENLGEKLSTEETDDVLNQIEFVNGRARIADVVDLIMLIK